MSSVTVSFTECESLRDDRNADAYSATVHFTLMLDGFNRGPCRSTIELRAGGGAVSAPIPEDRGIGIPSIPQDAWTNVVGACFLDCLRAGRLVVGTVPDDGVHLLRSVASPLTVTFETDPVPS